MRARLLKTAALALSTGFLGACGAAYGGGAAPVSASRAAPQPSYDMAAAPPPMSPPAAVAAPAEKISGTEDYKDYGVNPVVDPHQDRFSTFAVDVDTASYSIARRKI